MLENLALNRPADQSSLSSFSRGATTREDAAGGNNGQITGGLGMHTGIDEPSWWMVDLQAACEVHRFVLYNRLGLESRLRRFTVLSSLDGAAWDTLLTKRDDGDFGGADGHPFERAFDPPILARFVMIQQNGWPFLHFDECQVFGVRLPPDRRTGPPILGGEITPDFAPTIEVGSFGRSGRHERIELFAPAEPPPQIPLRSNVVPHPVVVEEHGTYPTPPAVNVYALHGATLWCGGLVTIEGRFVLLRDCLPSYFLNNVTPDGHSFDLKLLDPLNWAAVEHIDSSRPIACPLHPNLVYGHFLLEMLPRLYVLSVLKQYGADFAVAVPTAVPDYMKAFVRLYFPEDDLIWYDPVRQIVDAPSVIMASMMHTNYNLHPAFNIMVADLRARHRLPPVPQAPRNPSVGQRRIYLSRSRLGYNQRLLNEAEVEATFVSLGFAIVHPQEMSIAEQLALFDRAEVVAGEYTSALHNTLFSRPSTRVICIDFYSWYQSMIGRVRQQPHLFVAPDDGKFRNWRLPEGQQRSYRVDIPQLHAQILAFVPEAADAAPPAAAEPDPAATSAPRTEPIAPSGSIAAARPDEDSNPPTLAAPPSGQAPIRQYPVSDAAQAAEPVKQAGLLRRLLTRH